MGWGAGVGGGLKIIRTNMIFLKKNRSILAYSLVFRSQIRNNFLYPIVLVNYY